MSTKNKQNKPSLHLDGFGGIDCTNGHRTAPVAEDSVNFRICEDGSLRKRSGYRFFKDLELEIRAIRCDKESNSQLSYFLAGNRLYMVDFESDEYFWISTVSTSSGPACFFWYQGTLYLHDGKTFYTLTDGTLGDVTGYVPLIGKDWDNRAVGETFEPKNILNRRARISYIVSDPPSLFLSVPDVIESIDEIKVNGTALTSERYYYDTDFGTVNIQGLEAGDRVMLSYTYVQTNQSLLNALCQSTNVLSFGTEESNRLFFWNTSTKSKMFCSAYVSRESLQAAQAIYPDSDSLYVPEGYEFTVGDGQYKIQGAVAHYDRLLIFTEGDAWMATASSSGLEEFPTTGINADIGCAVANGVILAENTPITVGSHTIWQWRGETERLSERNAERISSKIDARLTQEDYRQFTVFYHRRESELWLSLKSRSEIWVYNLNSRNWYRYDGICADRFFEVNGSVGFVRDGKIFLLDTELTEDRESDSDIREIEAQYVSSATDFGSEEKKNLSALILRGDLDGGSVSVTVSGNGTDDVTVSLSDPKADHSVLCRRICSGSFRSASFSLKASGTARQQIHALTLQTR